ncbi:hypothetical protein KUCAC02_025883, partial [Chaenocephalus aceratus]
HYDTLATEIVYFHRFYMFHSFKQFPRYCVGEPGTPVCMPSFHTADLFFLMLRLADNLQNEEVMVLERILLQTIKLDLQQLKGDTHEVQRLVQVAWTFVNDRLCTTVALQWEPQIIAVAVMYLAGRLSKLDIQDWTSKPLSRRWWEQFVHDVPVEVLEDICHQILDLYSQAKQKIPDGGIGTAGTPPSCPSYPPLPHRRPRRPPLRPAPDYQDQPSPRQKMMASPAQVRLMEQQVGLMEQQVRLMEQQVRLMGQQVRLMEQQVGLMEQQVRLMEQQVGLMEQQ